MEKSKAKLITLASLSLKDAPSSKPLKKKIVHTRSQKSLRELFKKTFLPLLIDISELRLKLEDYKLQKTSGRIFQMKDFESGPEEILERLEQLQDDISETRRWCEGVITQIERGIDETQELLEFLGKKDEIEQSPRWKRLFKKQ